MEFETPASLLARLKLGREEYFQRLLTTLILDGPYPHWNTRSTPSSAGLQFLRALYQRSFESLWPGDDVVFVDEFDLPARIETERGGAPDYALLWPNRLWMIELKTEKASHRHDQIPGYYDLAHHHYPNAEIDLLYVTPPMSAPYQPAEEWQRYAHTTWAELDEPIRRCWPKGVAIGEQEVIDGLLSGLASLHLKPAAWRDTLGDRSSLTSTGGTVPVPEVFVADETDSLDIGLEAARLTAADGSQRGVEVPAGDLEELLGLRIALRDALGASPADSPLRHVMPWMWRWESTGAPLTDGGREHGRELRVSRYQTSRY